MVHYHSFGDSIRYTRNAVITSYIARIVTVGNNIAALVAIPQNTSNLNLTLTRIGDIACIITMFNPGILR